MKEKAAGEESNLEKIMDRALLPLLRPQGMSKPSGVIISDEEATKATFSNCIVFQGVIKEGI
jgi:hypothetical protein